MSSKGNTGVLQSRRTIESDEMYTPYYAVKPLLQFVKNYARDRESIVVWCPFDKEWSAFVVMLRENGYKVIHTHLESGQDFFEYEPKDYDLIISNPPFTKKDDVLKRLQELDKPFAMLLPINSLQGAKRFKYMEDIQLLFFDKRIGFHKSLDGKPVEGTPFASGYFCKDFLPKDLIGLELEKFDRSLKE